jgi:proline iminopeptidase
MIEKMIIPFSDFYIAALTIKKQAPYLLFIHGGPGSNSTIVEHFIENENLFSSLNYNIMVYDQRGCGRSKNDCSTVSHESNISDLFDIYQYLNERFPLKGFIGHSYGAKLLFDFNKQYSITYPSIYVSMSDSLLTPRINNLLLDMNYLKRVDPDTYEKNWAKITNFSSDEIWHITEELAPLFTKNPERPFFYWANLDIFKKVQNYQKQFSYPINADVFMNVRKNLYLERDDFFIDFSSMDTPYLRINGAQDFIINGGTERHDKTTVFYKSAHYPHLEENENFCNVVNKFLEKEGISHD